MVAENEVAEETIGEEVRNSLDGGRGRRPLGDQTRCRVACFRVMYPTFCKFRL